MHDERTDALEDVARMAAPIARTTYGSDALVVALSRKLILAAITYGADSIDDAAARVLAAAQATDGGAGMADGLLADLPEDIRQALVDRTTNRLRQRVNQVAMVYVAGRIALTGEPPDPGNVPPELIVVMATGTDFIEAAA